MLIDAAFLLLVAAAAAREIIAGGKWNNLGVVALVALLFGGNVAFHLEAHFSGTAETGIRVGVAVVVLLISLIGGRIIPSFTRNWLVRENPGRLPVPFARFDMLTIAASAIALLFWIVRPDGTGTGAALVVCRRHAPIRLGRWAGDRTARERLLLILHIGYAFVPLGFLLGAASAFGWVPAAAGVHAWMVGAAGVMTLAVMTRASLGHTGQPLKASAATQAIYVAIIVAASPGSVRFWSPPTSLPLLHLAALAWAAAFLGFAASHGPTLVGYRKPAARDPQVV